MLRSAEQIVSQTDQIVERFVAQGYDNAAKRQRGVSYSNNFSVDFILIKALKQNVIFRTLNTENINSIIDTLI